MINLNDNGFLSPNDFIVINGDDSDAIQNSIDNAVKYDVNKVIIPRFNKRTGKNVWIINKTILIPSDFTLVLDNCFLQMGDNVFCNMFRNSNATTQEGLSIGGEQKNIRIYGTGNSVLDGGKFNGLTEFNSLKNGRPHITENLMIYMHNIRDFTIENIKITNSRWWAMAFMFARYGKISDIEFCSTATLPNQDGIDLRVGCNNIIIENITGITGDDTVALTALKGVDYEAKRLVNGKDTDIHNVIIRNIIASSCGCNIVRLLTHHGNKMYNITIDTVIDTREYKAFTGVRVGDIAYADSRPCALHEMNNITVKNVTTSARNAIMINSSLTNSYFENIHAIGDCENVIASRGGEFANIIFDKIFYTADSIKEKGEYGHIFKLFNSCGKNVIAKNIMADKLQHITKIDGGLKIDISGIVINSLARDAHADGTTFDELIGMDLLKRYLDLDYFTKE